MYTLMKNIKLNLVILTRPRYIGIVILAKTQMNCEKAFLEFIF